MGELLAVRLAIGACLLPVLYRALGEEGEGWGRKPGSILRRLGFSLLGSAVFVVVSANWNPGERSPGEGRAFEAFTTAVQTFRLEKAGAGPFTRSPRGGEDPVIRSLRLAATLQPANANYSRYFGIVLADRGQAAAGLAEMIRAAGLAAGRDPERGENERRAWQALFRPGKQDPLGLRAAGTQVESLRLGWIGLVALDAGYRSRGVESPPELRARIAEGASRSTRRFFTAAIILLLLLPQLALVSLVVGAVLIHQKALRPSPRDDSPVGAPLWEAFILMLALYLLPALLSFGPIRRPGPGAPGWQVALLLLSTDVLQLIPLLYLALRLRWKGLGLGVIGLHGRSLGSNLLIGVMAFSVLTTASILMGLATRFLSDRYFPNLAPPYHPLAGYTVGSSSFEVRAALAALSVVGAPILEEIFFRGALFGALRRRWGLSAGLLASAVVFAALHPQLPLGFLPIAVLGAGFALLYDWRQSLIPAMTAHALNNGMAFLMITLAFPLQE